MQAWHCVGGLLKFGAFACIKFQWYRWYRLGMILVLGNHLKEHLHLAQGNPPLPAFLAPNFLDMLTWLYVLNGVVWMCWLRTLWQRHIPGMKWTLGSTQGSSRLPGFSKMVGLLKIVGYAGYDGPSNLRYFQRTTGPNTLWRSPELVIHGWRAEMVACLKVTCGAWLVCYLHAIATPLRTLIFPFSHTTRLACHSNLIGNWILLHVTGLHFIATWLSTFTLTAPAEVATPGWLSHKVSLHIGFMGLMGSNLVGQSKCWQALHLGK